MKVVVSPPKNPSVPKVFEISFSIQCTLAQQKCPRPHLFIASIKYFQKFLVPLTPSNPSKKSPAHGYSHPGRGLDIFTPFLVKCATSNSRLRNPGCRSGPRADFVFIEAPRPHCRPLSVCRNFDHRQSPGSLRPGVFQSAQSTATSRVLRHTLVDGIF